jgi:hypothetical protein
MYSKETMLEIYWRHTLVALKGMNLFVSSVRQTCSRKQEEHSSFDLFREQYWLNKTN